MKILKVSLENFVCYYGKQEIDLTPVKGRPVVIVHGDNGFGKTSLFRAISWCLFSKQGRRGFDAPSLFNWAARKENKSRCEVTVVFEDDDKSYTASRWYERSSGGTMERFSLEQSSFVDSKGKTLSEEEFDRLLERIFPYTVSTLFLFDGEELQKYENLVDEDKEDQSALIRARLEMVLGVPTLQAARTAASTTHDRLRQTYQAALSDATTDAAVRAELSHVRDEIKATEAEIASHVRERDRVRADFERVKRALQGLDAVEQLVREQSDAQRELTDLSERLSEAYQKRCEASTPLYVEIVRPMLDDTVADLRNRDRVARQAQIESLKLSGRNDLLNEVLTDGTCVCSTKIDKPKRVFVQSRIDGVADSLKALPSPDKQPLPWTWIADRVGEAISVDYLAAYSSAEGAVSGLLIQKGDLEGKISAIDQTLQSSEKTEIRSLAEQLASHAKAIEKLEGEIRNLEFALGQARTHEHAVEAQAMKGATKADTVKVEERRLAVAKEAAEVFESAIDELRQIKRQEVQKAASAAFVSMRWKTDFAGLRIQKGYGLIIQTAAGEDIPARSAGEGQIVALSLLAGLNRCANIKAPIIMDTPFSRLDRNHRSRVLQYLARMGEQVVLLATSAEVDDTDTKAIAKDIAKEWNIRFISHGRSEFGEVS